MKIYGKDMKIKECIFINKEYFKNTKLSVIFVNWTRYSYDLFYEFNIIKY